jgi:hypothetical protein
MTQSYAQPCFAHEYIQSDCPDCGKLSSENGQEVSELVAENERLRAENERLSRAVCSGILGDLLTPDENEALLAFVNELRFGSALPIAPVQDDERR